MMKLSNTLLHYELLLLCLVLFTDWWPGAVLFNGWTRTVNKIISLHPAHVVLFVEDFEISVVSVLEKIEETLV